MLKAGQLPAITINVDEEFIEFWLDDLIFESTHAANFHRIFTFRWWRFLVSWDHSVSILGLSWVQISWRRMLFLVHNMCEHCIDLGFIKLHIGKIRIPFLHFPFLSSIKAWMASSCSSNFFPISFFQLSWWNFNDGCQGHRYGTMVMKFLIIFGAGES